MVNNKKRILIFILSLLILVLIGLVVFIYVSHKNEKKVEISTSEDIKKDIEIRKNANVKFANKIEKRVKYVENLNEEYNSKDKEKFVMAKMYKLEKEDCDKVIDKSLQDDCIYMVNYNKIVNSNDLNSCGSLRADWRDKCIYDINMTLKNDWKSCLDINDKFFHDMCLKSYSMRDNNTELCDKMFYGVRSCYDRTKAINNGWGGDITNCSDIGNSEYFLMCVNTSGQDCNLLEDDYIVKRCKSWRLYSIILVEGDKEDCKALPLEEFSKTCEMYFDNNKKHIDFDGDGVVNGAELFCNTNPLIFEDNAKEHEHYETQWEAVFENEYYKVNERLQDIIVDTDDDGLRDYEEKIIYKTNPLKQDTDSDGYFDGDEVRDGFDPNDNGELNNELN